MPSVCTQVRNWLEAARLGDLPLMATQLAACPALLASKVRLFSFESCLIFSCHLMLAELQLSGSWATHVGRGSWAAAEQQLGYACRPGQHSSRAPSASPGPLTPAAAAAAAGWLSPISAPQNSLFVKIFISKLE